MNIGKNAKLILCLCFFTLINLIVHNFNNSFLTSYFTAWQIDFLALFVTISFPALYFYKLHVSRQKSRELREFVKRVEEILNSQK